MKILLTGGFGFLGSFVFENLQANGYNVSRFRSKEFDLRKAADTQRMIETFTPDIIINMAARLGGIGDNQNSPAFYFEDNILIGLNVMKYGQKLGVRKIINIGTVCSYPRDLDVPFNEANLWNGYPEGTNSAYGIAKRALIGYSEALKKQYNFDVINLLLANLYGPGDDFRIATSHVIPAIIRKIHFAKKQGERVLSVWGDGTPTRDFLYVEDAAEAIILSLNSDQLNNSGPINIATGKEVSIKQLVYRIAELMNFDGEIIFDTSKPNGQPRRLLSVEKAKRLLNFQASIDIGVGLIRTINYFENNLENITNQKGKYNDAI